MHNPNVTDIASKRRKPTYFDPDPFQQYDA